MCLEPTSVSKTGVGFTSEGWEKTWAVNYAANVLLILRLLGVMGDGARIVWLGSTSHDPSFLSNRAAFHTSEMKTIFKGEGKGDVEVRLHSIFVLKSTTFSLSSYVLYLMQSA